MDILFYADTVFSFGGVQRVLAEITKSLSSRHNVTILTTEPHEDLSMYGYAGSAVRFRHISYPPQTGLSHYIHKACSAVYKLILPHTRLTSKLYSYSFFPESHKRRLVEEINAGHYDAVIGVHVWLSLHLAVVRPRLNAPVVTGWMHNSYQALTDPHGHYLPRLRGFFRCVMPQLDRLIVLSQADACLFHSRLGLTADVVYNPLTVRPSGRCVRSSRLFLAIGRFDPLHKGFDLLIEAYAAYTAQGGDWALRIVGEGPEEAMYGQMIAARHLQERVELCPFTKDVGRHYRAASAYVLSSRWEGMPLVLVEAMAHGLPIAASALPVVEELLGGRGVAELFPVADVQAMARAMLAISQADNSRWQAMSDKAAEYARQFDITEATRQWEQLLAGD